MKKPIKTSDYHWSWYKIFDGDKGETFDGDTILTEHWLGADVFDSLVGGELSVTMGIRTYSTEESAMADLRHAIKPEKDVIGEN